MNKVSKNILHSFLTVKFDPCSFNLLYTIKLIFILQNQLSNFIGMLRRQILTNYRIQTLTNTIYMDQIERKGTIAHQSVSKVKNFQTTKKES
jgi:hypothetical protein